MAAPAYGALAGWQALLEHGRPFLELRLSARAPAPDPSDVAAVAAADVRGLWITMAQAPSGWASLAALRRALLAVRRAGKRVVVELEHAGNAELYLASAADEVYVRPGSVVFCVGLGGTMRFYGDALARLGLEYDVEAVGAYKSFGEAFSRGFATPPNREAVSAIVAELQEGWEAAICEGRGLSREGLRGLLAEGAILAEAAAEARLVDGVLHHDQVERKLEDPPGREIATRDFRRWAVVNRRRSRLGAWIDGRPAIAVLHLEGAVVDGDGLPGATTIGAGPAARAMERLGEDAGVHAVVLAIKSPGGSAAASEALWRAAHELGKKKPVVAALSDVAASGGYYLAVAAAEIVAEAGTLAGSIGVIAGKPVLRPALGRVGVHAEDVLGAPMAGLFTDRKFDARERAAFRRTLEAMYALFVGRVAAGRRMTAAAVEPVAQGRAWTGAAAHARGLVDGIGGVEDAIARAARLASVVDGRRVDVRVAARGSRLSRIARRLVRAAVPELAWVPRVPLAARLIADRPLEAMFLAEGEVEVT